MPDAALPILEGLDDYIAHYAWAQPTAPALIWETGTLSWKALDAIVERWAQALLAGGVKRRDRIAFLAPPRPEVVIGFLAASRVGAIWMGLNPAYSPSELERVVADAQPILIFLAPNWRRRNLSGLQSPLANAAKGARVLHLPAQPQLEDFPGGWPTARSEGGDFGASQPEDAFLLVYTSGSTGEPKGALLPRRAASDCSRVQHRYWGARGAPTRLINPFPINHVAFALDVACLVLVSGGTMVLQEGFDPKAYLAAVARHRITVVGLVPTMHQMLLDHPDFAVTDLSSVEAAVFGGAGASLDLVLALQAHFPRVGGAYGSTETAGQVLFSTDADAPEVIAQSLGRPVPGYALRLQKSDGRLCELGETGEIQLREAFMLHSYWRNPAATAAAFTEDGWLRTGDLAVERADGAWAMVGRLSDAFKSGGYHIFPREIEARLEAHPAVDEAVVVSAPDDLYGAVGIAFVQPRAGTQPSTETLDAWCREGLANYKVPKAFVLAEALPRLPVGKVDRVALRRCAALHHDTLAKEARPCAAL